MSKSKMMKALLVFGMSVVTATAMVGITACDDTKGGGGGGSDHEHVYDGEYNGYKANAEGHWHYCVVGEETSDSGSHTDNNHDNACDTCGWEMEHKFASEWTKDANGHYKAAECIHTTLRDQEGPHVDDGTTPGSTANDNICDVCGYEGATSDGYKAFVAAHASATPIINNTFFVSSTLPLFDSWGTAGLYASHDNATHKVDVSGGKANLITPNASPATCLYLDWGNANGIVEGYLDMSDFQNGVTGYTPVQFQGVEGGNGTEVFGLRADTNWKYRLDGGTAVALSENIAVADCNVYFSYNAATKKLTVKINDKVVVEDHQLNTALGGIKFSTGDGNNKTFSVDNVIVVSTPIDISAYRTALQTNATAEKAKITSAGFTVDTTSADNTFTGALDSATTNTDCDTAYTAYIDALVSAYKLAVNAKIAEKYPESSYNADSNLDKTAYTNATGTLTTDLAAANTVDKVTAAYTKADNALKGLHDNVYWNSTPFDITISGSEGTATITNKRAGDKVTKADLDAVAKVGDADVITGYTVDGTAVDFGTDGYVLSGAVTFVAVTTTATSDKGTYTYTLKTKTDESPTIVVKEGSLSDGTEIFDATGMITVTDFAGWKFGDNKDKIVLTLNVQAGQTVTLDLAGYTGSSSNAVAIDVTATNATTTAASQSIIFGASTSKTDIGTGSLTYTATAAGKVTLTLVRGDAGAGKKTTKLTSISVTVEDAKSAG